MTSPDVAVDSWRFLGHLYMAFQFRM